jgi:hypothetical protein
VAALAQIVRRFGPDYLKRRGGRVPAHQRKALRAIESCRTRRLGGIRRACKHCGHAHVRWHSCRNRHCPRCQQGKQQEWIAARLRELPPVPYAHLVFTVPAALAEHCRASPEALYRALFEAASQSVLQLAGQRYGIKPGMIAVLHTWGQNLHFHPHIHLIVTAGGMTRAGHWQAMPEGYCLPVRALSAIFRAKCFAALERLGQDLPAGRLPQKWVVHARKPQQDPGSLLLYLGRYVYRVAIDEARIQSVDGKTVTFRYKDYADRSKTKTMTLDGQEFLRRFLQHILPSGFVKVRHYGIFAHATKAAALKKLRNSLQQQGRSLAAATRAVCALLAKTTVAPPLPQCPRCRSHELLATEVMPVPDPLQHWPQAP